MLRWRINGEAIYSPDCNVLDNGKSLDGKYGSDAPLEHYALTVRICICNTPVVIILPFDRIIHCTVVVVLYLSPNACQYE